MCVHVFSKIGKGNGPCWCCPGVEIQLMGAYVDDVFSILESYISKRNGGNAMCLRVSSKIPNETRMFALFSNESQWLRMCRGRDLLYLIILSIEMLCELRYARARLFQKAMVEGLMFASFSKLLQWHRMCRRRLSSLIPPCILFSIK